MKWRRVNHILHRDIGFLCIGLTLIYGISGIAVNHLSHDFNPSYIIEKSEGMVSPLSGNKSPDSLYIKQVLDTLGIEEPLKNGAMLDPETVRIFTRSFTIDINHSTGSAHIERVKKVPLLFEFNYLHLNKAKGAWTWIADVYGVALCLLAITGLLMIRSSTKKRGVLLSFAGALLPAVYLLFF